MLFFRYWKSGKWYASLTVNYKVFRETGTGSVGLDFGTFHAVAMSDETIVDKPKFLAKTQEKIKKVSRQLKRKRSPNWKKKIQASKRWKKARKRISKLQTEVASCKCTITHLKALSNKEYSD